MKKLALLSAVMTLGISSWAFAADNPPPPPEKGAQHQGKPPAKNGQHDGKQAQHYGKQPQRDGKQPQHGGKQPQRDGKQPPKAASTAGNRCRQKHNPSGLAFCARLFFTFFQLTLTNSCPSLRSREKTCTEPGIVSPRH